MKQFFYRLRQMMAMGMYGRNGQDKTVGQIGSAIYFS